MPSAVAEVHSNSMHFLDKELPCRKWIHYFAIFLAHQPTSSRLCEFVINMHEAHIIFVIKEKRYVFGCSVSNGRVEGLANRHPECSLRVLLQRRGRSNISAIWKACHASADGKIGHEFVIHELSTSSQALVMILCSFQSTHNKHAPIK